MKQQINEIKKMQLIAGLITESEYQESLINEVDEAKKSNLEPESDFDAEDFSKKAKKFIDNHINIVKDAYKFYKKQDDDYEENLIDTIYDFFNQELGEDWTTQISEPSKEDMEIYNYGWTDDKDEVFLDTLKSALKANKLPVMAESQMDESKDINQTLTSGGFDPIDDEKLLIKASKILSLIGGNPSAEAVNALVMVIEDAEGRNISWDQ